MWNYAFVGRNRVFALLKHKFAKSKDENYTI